MVISLAPSIYYIYPIQTYSLALLGKEPNITLLRTLTGAVTFVIVS
jgi:hypothetical protein